MFMLHLAFVLMLISGPHLNYLIKDLNAKLQKKTVDERKLLYQKHDQELEHIQNLANSFSLQDPSTFKHFGNLVLTFLKYHLYSWAPILTFLRLLHIFASHLLKSSHCTYNFMDPGYLARNAAREGDLESLKWYINHGINPNFRDKRLLTLFEYLASNAAKKKNSADIYENYVNTGALLLQKGASFNAAITPVKQDEEYREMRCWDFREYFFNQVDWFAIFPKLIGWVCQYNIEKHFEDNKLVIMGYSVNPQDWNANLNNFHTACQNLLQN